MPDAVAAARGVYKPRRPQASPLFRLASDHLHRLILTVSFRESEALPGVLRLSSLLPSSRNPFVFDRILPAGTSPRVAIAHRSPPVSGRSGHNPTKLARESTYNQTTLVACL